jgi:intracellular multiplication protein IcmT
MPNANWRDSARAPRFFMMDARAAFPLLFFLLHIQWWSLIVALVATVFFAVLGRYGFTLSVFGRWLRTSLAGKRKYASPWWR